MSLYNRSAYSFSAILRTKSVSHVLAEIAEQEREERATADSAAGPYGDKIAASDALSLVPSVDASSDHVVGVGGHHPPSGGGVYLKKCLSVWDVMAYGVASTVGAGIFVITGQGAKSAGPAVVVSFLLASLSCLFSALSYSEFAARVPVSGSAYTFTYCCLGELAAWFIGWNLTLEYAISAAAVARGWSSNLLFFLRQIGTSPPDWLNAINVPGGGSMFGSVSILAALIIIICTGVLLLGVKESARFNLIVTVMNIGIILFIIVLGSFHIHTDNWHAAAPVDNVPSGCSAESTFTPCGTNGIITGAAQVFFSYIGFDSVTTLAEEVKNPKRDLPIGIMGTLAISTSLYIGASLVITGMVPWYSLESDMTDQGAPLALAFKAVGLNWAATLIAAITVTALTATTLTSLFGQPRIFYRMAQDGLLFKAFGILHPKTLAPLWGTIVTGTVAAIITFFLSLDSLSQMISIGTLMAFTTVCAGVVILRYQSPNTIVRNQQLASVFQPANAAHESLLTPDDKSISVNGVEASLTASQVKPTIAQFLWNSVVFWLFLYLLPCIGFAASLRHTADWPLGLIIFLGILTTLPLIRIAYLPVDYDNLPDHTRQFICPLVPWLPCLGIFTNVYLIASLDYMSYVRIVVWTAVGFSIYFAYGIVHSKLAPRVLYNQIKEESARQDM